ncbi:hypothetical protein KKA39_00405 [Patescibacteria group bacterium]|nr:hypothetical protein [Patescibacteria group bacterium]
MFSKIKNIILFLIIVAILILAYFFFFKKAPDEASLVSTSGSSVLPANSAIDQNSEIGKDFLSILLNVKNIKLDDSIFSDPAFVSLRDSSIILISDGNEGRPNPFAPIGSDITATVVNSINTSLTTDTDTDTDTDTNTNTETNPPTTQSIIDDLMLPPN